MIERFYANAPKECNHPWILRRYDAPERVCLHEIVDVGVLDLKKFGEYKKSMLFKWKTLETKGWKVVPDCPDFEELNGDNVEMSKELIFAHYDPFDRHQMPVIQCKMDDYDSVVEYSKWLKMMYGQPKQLGISGTIGKSDNREFVYKSIKEIRRRFPKTWLHIFALKKFNLVYKDTYKYFNSYDSASWTMDTNGSAINKEEQIEYFKKYVKKLKMDVKGRIDEYG